MVVCGSIMIFLIFLFLCVCLGVGADIIRPRAEGQKRDSGDALQGRTLCARSADTHSRPWDAGG
jgi:hypothetical protein